MTQSGGLRRDGEVVPLNDSTPEYQAYVAWLAAGNGPQIVDEEPAYPRIEVTAWKLIQALDRVGLLSAIDAAASASSDPLVRMGWQRAPYFYSDSELVLKIAADMGIQREQIQTIFELATTF